MTLRSMTGFNQGFLFAILWQSWSGNHPQEDLATFGDVKNYENKKINTLLYFRLPIEEDKIRQIFLQISIFLKFDNRKN
jgi:hypothetical protein